MILGAGRGAGSAGLAVAMSVRSRLARPGRRAAVAGAVDRVVDRVDERARLRQHLPSERRHRGNAHRHDERDRGHHGGQAGPPEPRPVRRCGLRHPVTIVGPAGRAGRAGHHPLRHRLQPRQGRLQPAPCAPGQLGACGHHPGHRQRVRRGQPGLNPLQAVIGGLYPVHRGMQRAAEQVLVVPGGPAHASPSSTPRNADMARAVWTLTAPRLIPIAEAICASENSP